MTATLRRILRRRGGLRQFARSLRTHAETISFTAPATGTIAVKVYLGERRAHRRRPRHALVAAAQRTLHGTGRTRVPVRPTERGRHELRRDFGRRITVRLCFTPRGNRRLAASARVRSG